MKKIFAIIWVITIFISMTSAVYAGDLPEIMLYEDDAKVFVGRVENYTMENSQNASVESVEITPTLKIKGDVEIGVSALYNDWGHYKNPIPQKGTEYLFGYIGEKTLCVFEIESIDNGAVKLKYTDEYAQAERLQNYLDEGSFAFAEEKRVNLGKQISFAEFLKKDVLSDSGIEKVNFTFKGKKYEIDKDKFFDIAENILITDVKDGKIKRTGEDDAYDFVLSIELTDGEGKWVSYAAITEFGEVDRYSLTMSRMMAVDYEMKTDDLVKLYELIPEKVWKDVGVSVEKTENNCYTYIILSAAGIAVILIIAGSIIIKKRR